MKSIQERSVLAIAGVAVVAALSDGDPRPIGAGPGPLEDAERLPEQPLSPRDLRPSGWRGRWSASPAATSSSSSSSPVRWCPALECSMPPRRDRSNPLHDGRLPHRQASPRLPSSPRCRSARASASIFAWMIYGGGKDLQNEIYARQRSVLDRLRYDRARDLGLVQARRSRSLDGLKGLKMRFFGLGAQVMDQARRLDAAARRPRHLPGARARRHRRHRVLDAQHGHRPRLLSDRQVQLLSGLASAVLDRRAADEQGGLRRLLSDQNQAIPGSGAGA